jgi:ribose transport system substrate-binding protein
VKRLILLVAVVTFAASACGGATPAPAANARKVVGVSLLTQVDHFYQDLEVGLREEAAARNLDLIVVACEMDPAKQAAQVEDFVAKKVAAILVAPCDSSAIGAQLAGPEAAGIPVFTADISAHSGKIVSHVASDNVLGGALAAKKLAELLGDKGKVLIIDHPTVASVQDRVKGFEEEMKQHPGITIVGKPSSDGQRAKAMSVMEDMLQAHRDLKGVFGINDPCALGAVAVLKAAKRTDIVVVGYDASPEAQAAILEDGPLKADVVQLPKDIGHKAIEMIARHLAGETVPPLVSVNVGIVDAAALKNAKK